jgi:uracil-DNA glycosylase family 4
VSDAKRRWLELQRDLGGDEVIFDAPFDVRAAIASDQATMPARVQVPGPASPAPAAEATRLTNRTAAAAGRSDAAPAPTLASPTGSWTTLDQIAEIVRGCKLCSLCETRTNAVPGEGNPAARLMLVGEGPGESEDLSGRPFVGRAGDLLTKMLEAIQVPRTEAYIANVVKCRPPKNRVPLPDERAACMPYLRRQIELVKPRVLLALGSTASAALLDVKSSLGALRGREHDWNGIPLIVTYHPAALLRNPDWKRPAWDDLRTVRKLLDRDT